VVNKISEGGYATVYQVRDQRTQEIMALKKILIRKDDKVFADMIRNEVKLWKEMGKHPHIVELYDYCTWEEEGGKYVLVLMEICQDGHLLDLLEKHNGKLSEAAIIALME
jgi:serine/threonine protein kinase